MGEPRLRWVVDCQLLPDEIVSSLYIGCLAFQIDDDPSVIPLFDLTSHLARLLCYVHWLLVLFAGRLALDAGLLCIETTTSWEGANISSSQKSLAS